MSTSTLHLFLLSAASLVSLGQSFTPAALTTIRSNLYEAVGNPLLQIQNAVRDGKLYWCGFRDTAPTREAVSAAYPNLDACCRMHDLCPMIIDRGECRGDLCNSSFLFPILDCACDVEFRRCLKAVTSDGSIKYSERALSETIGVAYFSFSPKVWDRQCIGDSKTKVKLAVRWEEL